MNTVYFIHGGAVGILMYAGFFTSKKEAVKELRRRKKGSMKNMKGCKVVAIKKF